MSQVINQRLKRKFTKLKTNSVPAIVPCEFANLFGKTSQQNKRKTARPTKVRKPLAKIKKPGKSEVRIAALKTNENTNVGITQAEHNIKNHLPARRRTIKNIKQQ